MERKPERLYLCWRCGISFEGFLYREPSGCTRCHRADWLKRRFLSFSYSGRQDAVDRINTEVIGQWLKDKKDRDIEMKAIHEIKQALCWFSSWAKRGLTAEEMYDERDKIPRNEKVLMDAFSELRIARNALNGISNEALEAGVVGEMVTAFKSLRDRKDSLLCLGINYWKEVYSILAKLEGK